LLRMDFWRTPMRPATFTVLLTIGLAGWTGCEIEILQLPAGVLRVDECVECYDTIVEEVWVEEPVYVEEVWVEEPVYVEEVYYPEVIVEEPVYEEVYYEEVYYEEEFVAGEYYGYDYYADWEYFDDDWDEEYEDD